ncbi:uncharacterized protein LOC111684202 [Lucilia cuprina]|uniref:uncharacterized protein LOC111684202 n=1 Tax=Lucilia cuprina TaxID=7375 RepID=UPI001F06689D|nr:uncharacterized protein LOC111684202 [Lucilia cuprina]
MDNNIPILTDTEAETSMEQDFEEKIPARVSNATVHNATKSLFNITFENLEEQKHESVEFKDHERRLQQEMKDWKSFLFQAYKDLKESKQKHPVVDKTILSHEKREYLERADCLQNFIRESIEFRQQASLFLDYDYAEYMEMVDNLETLCDHRLQVIKANKIAENLANVKRKTN